MTAFDAWLPWLYQYGVGGVMAAATAVVSLRVGALDRRSPRDRRLLAILASGYFGFLALHAVWILAVFP